MIFNQLRFLFQEKLLCLDDIIFPDFIKGASIQAVNLILFVISPGTKTTSARFWPWMWAFILPSVVIVTFFNVSIIRLQIKHVLKCAQPSGLPEEAGSGEKLLNLPVCFGGSVICRCLWSTRTVSNLSVSQNRQQDRSGNILGDLAWPKNSSTVWFSPKRELRKLQYYPWLDGD